jgi:hypothetical protein
MTMASLMIMRAAVRSRDFRRLAFASALLIIADLFEPAVLRSLERRRYEDRAQDFRFASSDFFALGPLVAYFRDRPRGDSPRVIFLGNSITHGHFLTAAEAFPAGYQRLDPSVKIFNLGINGFQAGSSFLVAKAAIDAVDLVYVLDHVESRADPILPRLIPVDEADRTRFHLAGPSRTEARLSWVVNHWRLYRDAYRLQAALFGTSTQEYLHRNKGTLARSLIARLHATERGRVSSDETIAIEAPASDVMPEPARHAELRRQHPELWAFGDLFAARRKPVELLHIPGYSDALPRDAIADFNRVFAPYGRILILHIPPALTFDGAHLTRAGAAQLARALWTVRPERRSR